MSDLRLCFAGGRYERTAALFDGSVKPGGVTLTCLDLRPSEVFWRQLRHREFEVSEMSLSSYLALVARGQEDFVGLPVFPSRVFRHGSIFVTEASGISRPDDLRGRRLGVPEYHMTAALFVRGLLADEYGVVPSDISWIQAGLVASGRRERVDLDLPEDVSLEVRERETLIELLARGEIDGAVVPSVPEGLQERAGVRRLFSEPRAVERAYYLRTGVFPIMHLVVLRRDVYDAHPWVAPELVKAFEEAKAAGWRRAGSKGAIGSMLPWYQLELEETLALADDMWAYGLERNEATLAVAVRYAHEQALTPRRVEVGELFAANALLESAR